MGEIHREMGCGGSAQPQTDLLTNGSSTPAAALPESAPSANSADKCGCGASCGADCNCNGQATKVVESELPAQAEHHKAEAKMDTNKDGVVDANEFAAAGGSKADFELADLNHDGVLDAEEIARWFKHGGGIPKQANG